MNNIVSKLKDLWQYLKDNPSAHSQFKEKYTTLLGKAKSMLTPKSKPEAGVSPRQNFLNMLAKKQQTYNPVGQTQAQRERETKTPTTLEEEQRIALKKDYARKALSNF